MERNKTLPLHTKYRPQNFNEFVGNDSVKESLQAILSRTTGEVRTFLFTGPSGTGKTTLARIISNELKCSPQDFHEFNVASVRGIDTIREIASNSRYFPLGGKIKIYLLDEFHKSTTDAQNAILKLLEDTPNHVRFILCTTDPEKLIKTIKTRCTTFALTSLRRNELMKLLKWVCTEEKVDINLPVLQKVAEYADGSPRQALVLLDQIIDIEDDEMALQTIIDTSIGEINIIDLCKEFLKPKIRWENLSPLISKIDEEPEKIRYAILTYMMKVLLGTPSDRVVQIIELFSASFMYSGKAGLAATCYLATKIN